MTMMHEWQTSWWVGWMVQCPPIKQCLVSCVSYNSTIHWRENVSIHLFLPFYILIAMVSQVSFAIAVAFTIDMGSC